MDSLWLNSVEHFNGSDLLKENLETDACIIGAGVFGTTCAYYLLKLGFSVILVDKGDLGHGTTGFSTGKITSQHGLFYDYLINSFGIDFAYDYLCANEGSIESINKIIDEENIKCDFEYKNNFVYSLNKSDLKLFEDEKSALDKLNFKCDLVSKTSLPFDVGCALCFKSQAQFNPIKYVDSLYNCILNNNGLIFSNTVITDVKQDGEFFYSLSLNNMIKSKFVIVATHFPFINIPGFYFTKMYQSTSYVIAVETKKTLPSGMYVSNSSPIFSFRTAKYNGKDVLIVAGGDHKTGDSVNYDDTYGVLENEVKKYYPDSSVLFKWSSNDCISLDKIPYVGSYSAFTPNMFVGTGFKKWGFSSSNIAANIIVDKICGKQNKFEYLFDSSRLKPIKNFKELKNVSVQTSKSLIFDKFKVKDYDFSNISNDSGSVVKIDGVNVGIYKDPDGNVFAVNPVCSHLGCLLAWNNADKTWDCPCHGSRFNYRGECISDPAFKSLETFF